MKKKTLIFVALLVSGLCASALASGPLGPPTAGLKKGQFGIAAEYAYSRSSVETSGYDVSGTIKGLESNMFLAQPGYGVTDDWEIYAFLGAADNQGGEFDFDYGFAYGFGTKFTFIRGDTLSWGALFEIGWKTGSVCEAVDLTELVDWYYFEEDCDAELSCSEIMIAVGPTWEAAEDLRIYGGPFFYRLNGDIDVDVEFWGDSLTLDLEEKSQFGGYVGTELDVGQNTTWYGEFQFTGDMWVFGVGISWRL